jgi:uncharacterized membrane protein
MADIEEKRELGSSLMFIGLALWVADLLVVFYLPAAMKLGRHGMFIAIIAVLAVMGLILMMTGYGLRRKTEAS